MFGYIYLLFRNLMVLLDVNFLLPIFLGSVLTEGLLPIGYTSFFLIIYMACLRRMDYILFHVVPLFFARVPFLPPYTEFVAFALVIRNFI